MFPWGHLAVGYLLYSPLVHLLERRRPDGLSVVVLAIATQLPDLVDKSLSWLFGLFPQGYAIGHSVFVAVPLGVAAILVMSSVGRPAVGAAVAVGHWSHLLADVFVATVFGLPYTVERVLWPVVALPPYESATPPLGRVIAYLLRYAETVVLSGNVTLLVIYLGPVVAAFTLWLADGAPGFPRASHWQSRPRGRL